MSEIHPEEEDSYFVSMTDLMVGMLFVFILLLLALALQQRELAQAADQIVDEEVDRDDARIKILKELQTAFAAVDVKVLIVPEEGILRLPEHVLFERGSSTPSDEGQDKIEKLSAGLLRVASCYASGAEEIDRSDCETTEFGIETLMVEGHTDSAQFRQGNEYDNLDLSLDRAANVYRLMTDFEPSLRRLVSPGGQPILSVSGFADQRPVDVTGTVEGDKRNRRIDLRLIMSPSERYRSALPESSGDGSLDKS